MRLLWDELTKSRAFWLSYVSAAVSLAGSPTLETDRRQLSRPPYAAARLTLSFPSVYLLSFEVGNGHHSLQLSGTALPDAIELGSMDAHAMPDLLRWAEYRDLVACLARDGQPVWAGEMLLSLYVAPTVDCAADRAAVVQRGLKSSGVFTDDEADYVSGRMSTGNNCEWVERPGVGWLLEGKRVYSLRTPNAGFDFRAFDAFLAAARHA